MTESNICPICKNYKRTGSQASLTQWIAACTCDLAGPEADTEIQKISVKFCKTCGKRVETGRAGSFTQFIFRSDTCQCERPDIPEEFKETPHDVQGNTQELEEEIEQELEYSIDEFPYERYKPIKKLGQGTGGTVYLARDKLLNKKVAVKMLHLLEPKQLVSFHEEAKATSKLNHSSIVQVLDFGATKSGTPYMVLEYISGTSLELKLIESGKLDFEDCRFLFDKILDAISYAHANGIFHRDIKPGNILLEDSDEELQVRLIDFGIAKVKDPDNEADDAQGKTLAGAPLYMSPDQGRGKSYDARSEIYSLGCVLFECLTGKPPFLGDNALATLSMHANDPVPSIQGQVEETIEVELQSLLEKALAKEPDNRYQTVNEFKSSLEEIGTKSYSATAKTASSPEPQKSSSAKLPALIALALGTATIAATGITLYTMNPNNAKHPEAKIEKKVPVVKPHIADTTNSAIESGPIWSEVTEFSVEGMNLTDDSMKKLNEICPDMQTLQVAMSPNFTGVGLGFIKNKEKVKLIRVESAHFGENGAKKLLEFPNLSQVRVYYSSAFNIEAIRTIARIPHLTHIELRDCTFPKDAISVLSNIKKLAILDLTGSKPISKNDLESLKKLDMNRLKIGRYPLDDTFVPTLLKLNVKNLLLTDTKLTGKGFTKLAQLKSLKNITITQSDLINAEDIKYFEKIRPDTEIILRDQHGQRVVDSTPVNRSTMFNIEKGDFSYSNGSIKGFNVKDKDFIAIANSYPDALLLKLSNSSVTGEGLKYLNPKNKLRTIRIESDIFNEIGARQLLSFPALSDVRIYSATKMSTQTLKTIARVPNLTILELQHIAEIPPTTFSIISGIKNLKSLSLFGSRPIDKDDLVNLSKLTKLKKLSLSSTPVDDNCIPAILSIKCPKIDLNHTRITDSGLSQLENLKTLKELGLSVNKNLSVVAIKKFRDKRKDCKVKVYDTFGIEHAIGGSPESHLGKELKYINNSIDLLDRKKSEN